MTRTLPLPRAGFSPSLALGDLTQSCGQLSPGSLGDPIPTLFRPELLITSTSGFLQQHCQTGEGCRQARHPHLCRASAASQARRHPPHAASSSPSKAPSPLQSLSCLPGSEDTPPHAASSLLSVTTPSSGPALPSRATMSPE